MIDNIISAFIGALFAFAFVLLGRYIERASSRITRGYNELVYLEGFWNRCLVNLSNNRFIIPNFISALKEGNIYLNDLHQFPLKMENLADLPNINFINRAFLCMIDLERVNNDMVTTNTWNRELRKSFIEKHIDLETYKVNANYLAQKIEEMDKFMISLQYKLIDILSENRVLIRKYQTWFFKFLSRFMMNPKKKKVSLDEFRNEKKKLLQEIEIKSEK